MLRSWSFLLAVVVWAACGPMRSPGDDTEIQLRVQPAAASPGDSLLLVLENASADAIGYNLCTSSLERHSEGTWQPVPTDRVCTLELRTLDPGQRAQYTYSLPPQLPPGEYRTVTGVEHLATGRRLSVESEPFRIEA